MKMNFLNFVASLTDPDCPWDRTIIVTHISHIDVKLVTSCIVTPSNMEWLISHVRGGRWFITSEKGGINLIVRFEEIDEE